MEDFSSEAYMILSIAYMILCTMIILYDRKEMVIGMIHSIQTEIRKREDTLKNRRYYIIFMGMLIFSIFLYTFSHEEPSKITFNRIEEIFSHSSVLVFCEDLDIDDRIYIIDMYWGWGKANLERPGYSPKYSDSMKNKNNLICLISKRDTMFDDLKKDLGIEKKYEEQDLKSNIKSLAMLVGYDNINYLILSENEPRGLGAAMLYLSNPATWAFHKKDSDIYFLWEDYDGDGKIKINEIDVKPEKNQVPGYNPPKKGEIDNQLFEEFRKDAAIVLGASLNTFDLLSAGNIVWSLSYYFRESEKPIILCDYEETEAKNIIIIGGIHSNSYAEEICVALDLTAAYDSEYGTTTIQIENQTVDLLEIKQDVDDLCIIASKSIGEKNMVWIAGLEGNGTYVGSIFLSLEKNWEYLYEQNKILILGWKDKNYNKSVELNEISVKFQIFSNNSQEKSHKHLF